MRNLITILLPVLLGLSFAQQASAADKACRFYTLQEHHFIGQIYFDSGNRLRIEYEYGTATPAIPLMFNGASLEAESVHPSGKERNGEIRAARDIIKYDGVITHDGTICDQIINNDKYVVAINAGEHSMYDRWDYQSTEKLLAFYEKPADPTEVDIHKLDRRQLEELRIKLGDQLTASISKGDTSVGTGGAPLIAPL